MTDLPDKVRVDFQELTFRELGDALDAAGVDDLATATGGQKARANAAIAWVRLRRDYPDVTLDEVLDLPMAVLEVVGAGDPGNLDGATDGGTPPASLAPGGSDRSTS